MQAFRLQDLPVELERSIFEIAARLDLKTAMNLSLVCRQLKEWIQPLIYEMVTLGTGDSALFLRTMEMLPADFFARSVKRLCLTVSINPNDAQRILRICTGISNLACWVDFIGRFPLTPSTPFRELLHPLRLRRLSIEAAHFQTLSFPECAWIHSLTYLDLVFWKEDSLLIRELRFLPALTHLALLLQHSSIETSALAYILSILPSLQILCLVTDEDDLERYEQGTRLLDPRVVCLPHPESVLDWEAPYRGRPDMWSQAEEIIEQRQLAANQVRIVSQGQDFEYSMLQ
ncbi:hypothetical protein F5876DRAFT_42275 [Lentinula aff. lateritia]|uniref:Uncharacterized protein n=1 Tax=Lentinula aff. lateritia TaxID=2804960 RepID=A0ACC1U042_9AGAR|nr:hypothetical protein F5876DRAFT_42275 [Lentinula aff. lateritia]